MSKELHKVRNISLSLFDDEQNLLNELTCEFGTIIEKEGIIFLEVYLFENDKFNQLLCGNMLGCSTRGRMTSFENFDIETPDMALTSITTKENKVTFRCFGQITINQIAPGINLENSVTSQLLRVYFYGLDLLIQPNAFSLVVSNVPFEIKFKKDEKTGNLCAYFPHSKCTEHNILTDELFVLFRQSLIGYLSLINGASVQIIREDYIGYYKLYSFNRIENISRSQYLCGNAKLFRPSSILYEFDNYIRWDKCLNLNKFIHHLCAAQQLTYMEDRSFILIIAFEGLCGNYEKLFAEEYNQHRIIQKETYDSLKKDFFEILKKYDIPDNECTKLKNKISQLNDINSASNKFGLILDNLNIPQTSQIKKVIKKVRNTLVHEATLSGFEEYELLSELLREILIRLINSNVKRYSYFEETMFLGEAPKLSFDDYIREYKLDTDTTAIIADDDTRINLRIYPSQS